MYSNPIYSLKDVECLALNIHFEARGESTLGQLAVAQVTINRSKDSRWPKSICGVVYQKNQFSWTSIKQKPILVNKTIATTALYSNHPLKDFKAVYYHAYYVKPYWAKHFKYHITIGNHIFYYA